MQEIWKDIPNYEGYYQVSNLGQVKSVKRNLILKQNTVRGYKQVTLQKQGTIKNKMVHRLVLETFSPCQNMEKLQVNHKDENKINNCLDNLEWLTAKENVNYGTRTERQIYTQIYHNYRCKAIICVETNQSYISIRECSRITGIDKASISRCLKGKQKTAGGYHWKYLEAGEDQ